MSRATAEGIGAMVGAWPRRGASARMPLGLAPKRRGRAGNRPGVGWVHVPFRPPGYWVALVADQTSPRDLSACLVAAIDCVRRANAGHQDRTHRRHDLMASYWFQCKLLELPELGPGPERGFHLACQLTRLLTDRLGELTSTARDALVIRQTIRQILVAIDAVVTPMFAERIEAPTSDELARATYQALSAIFQWSDLDRLAVYLFVFADEIPPRPTLKSEKSRVLTIIERCLDQNAPEVAARTRRDRGEESEDLS